MAERAELLAILNLLSVDGIGSSTVLRLVQQFGSARKVFLTSEAELRSVPRFSSELIARLRAVQADGKYGQEQLEKAENIGVELRSYWDENYPGYLKRLEFDAPVILFIKGKLEPEARRLAIVGTRSASEYGKRMTIDLIRGLRNSGVHIVSGLASGVDGYAHETALECGLTTQGVLGCGVDIIYPPSHKDLAQKIADSDGALLSEFPLGTGPDKFHFPQRNRIIAGLCQATLVIEAGEKSGALITARLAADYNREVMAVPGAVTNPKSRGCHELIKTGAALIEKSEDILELLKIRTSPTQKTEQTELQLPDHEMNIYKALDYSEAQHIDSIAIKLSITVSDALGKLLLLEMKGAVRQLPGKYFVRA